MFGVFLQREGAIWGGGGGPEGETHQKKKKKKEKTPPPAVPVHTASGIACAACGKVNSPGTKFCCECGGKLEAPAAPQTKTCPECGAAVAGGLRFCGECGARLEG